jgi:hypothetical protein
MLVDDDEGLPHAIDLATLTAPTAGEVFVAAGAGAAWAEVARGLDRVAGFGKPAMLAFAIGESPMARPPLRPGPPVAVTLGGEVAVLRIEVPRYRAPGAGSPGRTSEAP